MLAYLALSICVSVSIFLAYVVGRNKALVFSSTALLSLLPITYVVSGTCEVLSKLSGDKVLSDFGSLVVMLVQEPIKLVQRQATVQYPFALLGLAVFLSLAVGIVQVICEKRKTRLSAYNG